MPIGPIAAGRRRTGATAHAYWRVYVTAVTAQTIVGVVIDLLEFRATVGGANQVPTCTTYNMGASGQVIYSTDFGGNEAWQAFGVGAWAGATVPQWVGFQFPSAVNVEQIAITTASDTRWIPVDFKVQYSDNGSTWYDRASFTGQSLPVSTTTTFLTSSAPPTFSVVPTISTNTGFYGVGDIATVGGFTHNGTSTTYQWRDNGSNIGGATSASFTYVSTSANVDCVVTATNSFGSTPSTATGHAIVTPTYTTVDRLLMHGDMQSGTDLLLMHGDMNSGTDKYLLRERTA